MMASEAWRTRCAPTRRTFASSTRRKTPTVQERFAGPIKQVIEPHPSFGYRTVAYLVKFNKNTVQHVFQIKHWQVRKRPVGFRPRVQATSSGPTIGGHDAERTLGDRLVSRVERS